MRNFILDDPDVKMSLYELSQLKKRRQEFRRLKGYEPPEFMDLETLEKQIEEVRKSAAKK